MALFVIFILVWVAFGAIGQLTAKREGINYSMIIFLLSTPIIPVIAYLCGIK